MNATPKSPAPPPNLLDGLLFPDLLRGTFIRRPNRFVVRCAVEGGVIDAYRWYRAMRQ